MMWGYGGGWGWGAWFLMFALMLAFWAVVVWLIVKLVRRDGGSSRAQPPQPVGPPGQADPLHILDERYARGEVDDEEYQRRRAVLTKG